MTPQSDTRSSSSSRRELLGTTLLGAAALSFAQRARASNAQLGGPRQYMGAQLFTDLRLLVERVSLGWSPALWARAQQLGYDAFLEEQLNPASIDDSAAQALLAGLPTLTLTSKQIYDNYTIVQGQQAVPINELKAAWVLRATYSKRQLFERMVEFWNDHFNIDINDGEGRTLKTADDRDVIRQYALTSFPEILDASAHSGAMMVYLDNYSNKKQAPNENYSRELMELHTLEVGNYTELDIKELARCLTGWSRYPASDPNYGDFAFVSVNHDINAKVVLGTAIPAGGNESDGMTMLAVLNSHTATAHFISLKMCRWFLGYAPPTAVVDRVALVFLTTGGDVKSMLREILSPATMLEASAAQSRKIKRPFHLAVSALRASGASVASATGIANELATLGQPLFSWPSPDGYPDTAEAWGEALLPRWSFLSRLFSNSIAGTTVDAAGLLVGVPQSQLAAAINTLMTGGTMSAQDVQEVQDYVNSFGSLTDTLRREALALTASSPSFQWY